jgi:hypothetical protein
MDTQIITKKLIEISSENHLSPADKQLLLFVWTRQLLENENLKKDFPIVLLYSNWALHIGIDRDHECGPIISRISKSLFIMEQCQTTLAGVISILKSLLFRELIIQFHQLFSKYSLPTMSFEFPDCTHFLNQFISELLIDKPITFKPDKKTRKYFDDITDKAKGKEIMAIESIYFHFYPDYGSPDDPNSSAFCAVCQNRKGIKICIPIEFNLWPVIFSKETNFDAMLSS